MAIVASESYSAWKLQSEMFPTLPPFAAPMYSPFPPLFIKLPPKNPRDIKARLLRPGLALSRLTFPNICRGANGGNAAQQKPWKDNNPHPTTPSAEGEASRGRPQDASTPIQQHQHQQQHAKSKGRQKSILT